MHLYHNVFHQVIKHILSFSEEDEITSTDMSKIFGVVGVPTLIIVHPEGENPL